MAEFEQGKTDIAELKGRKPHQTIFDPGLVKSDDDEGIMVLIVRLMNDK